MRVVTSLPTASFVLANQHSSYLHGILQVPVFLWHALLWSTLKQALIHLLVRLSCFSAMTLTFMELLQKLYFIIQAFQCFRVSSRTLSHAIQGGLLCSDSLFICRTCIAIVLLVRTYADFGSVLFQPIVRRPIGARTSPQIFVLC